MLAMQACPLDWLQSKGFVQEATDRSLFWREGQNFHQLSNGEQGIGIGIAGKRYPMGILLQNGRRLSGRLTEPDEIAHRAPRQRRRAARKPLHNGISALLRPVTQAASLYCFTRCDVPDISTLWIESRFLYPTVAWQREHFAHTESRHHQEINNPKHDTLVIVRGLTGDLR